MKKIEIEETIRRITEEFNNNADNDATRESCLDQSKTLCKNNPESPDAMFHLAQLSMHLDLKDESLRACEKYIALMKQSRDKKTTLDRSTVTTLLTICINGFKRQVYPVLLDVCDYLDSEPWFKKDDIIAVRKMLLLENGDVESWLNLSKEMHSRSPYEALWIMGHEVDIIDVRKMLLEKGDLESWCKLSKEMNSRFPDEPQWFIGSITSLAYRKDLKESYKKMRNLIKRLSQKGKKNNESHLVPEVESFMLHLSILDQEKNYKYAKPILEELKEPEYSFNRYRKRGIMYSEGRILAADKKCNQAAAEIFKNLFVNFEIDKFPNNLQCFLHYLSCILNDGAVLLNIPFFAAIHPLEYNIHPLKLANSDCSRLHTTLVRNAMHSASAWVKSLKHRGGPDFTRFYHLAILEIETRKIKNDCCDKESLSDLLLESFRSCGHFLCFPFDVETFFLVFTDEEKKNLLRKFESILDGNNDTDFLCKKTSIFKLQKLLGLMFDLPVIDLERDAINMTELFIRSLPLQELVFEQSMPGEDLPCLVCDLLVLLYCRSQHLSYLVQAVFVLEFGLKVKRRVSKYIILLVHLYSHLGAYQLAYKWYKELNFENKSMVFSQLLTSPFFMETDELLSRYLLDEEDYFKEKATSIHNLYLSDEVLKAVEDIHLFYRLKQCHKYLMPKIERHILQPKLGKDCFKFAEVFTPCDDIMDEFMNNLTFQKAVESAPWWSPTPFINFLLESSETHSTYNPVFKKLNLEEIKYKSQEIGTATMKKRALLSRLIHCSVSDKTYDELILQYAFLGGFSSFEKVENTINEISAGYKSLKDDSEKLDIMNLAVFVYANKFDKWSLLDNLFTQISKEKTESTLQFSRCPGAHISFFVQMVTETISLHIAIMTVKKMKIGTQIIRKSIESTRCILEKLKACFKKLKACFKVDLLNSSVHGSDALSSFGDDVGDGGFGDGIRDALSLSWEKTESFIIGGLTETLSEVIKICDSKLNLLDVLESQLNAVNS